jgi:hypothetical protein
MFLAAALVPDLQFYPLASDLSFERVVIEDGRHVLHVELVRGVAQQQVCLAHARVTHQHNIESFQMRVGLGVERTDSTEIVRDHFIHYYNLYSNNYILYGVVYFTLIKNKQSIHSLIFSLEITAP